MAATELFVEDEVCKKNDDGGYVYGLVFENSEYASSDDDEEDKDSDRLRRGTVKIVWHPEGKETIETESKMVLADRSLMPGDVIRKLIIGKNSPRGFVQDTAMKCHLHIIGTNKYIYNVDSKDLRPMQGYELDAGEVTMDSWVGRPEVVNQQIQVVFPDGAQCLVMDGDLCMMECTSHNVNYLYMYSDDLYGPRGLLFVILPSLCNIFQSHFLSFSLQDLYDAGNKQIMLVIIGCSEDRIRQILDSEFSFEGCYYRGQTFSGYMKDLKDAKWIKQTLLHNARRAKKSRLPVCVRVEEVALSSVEVQWLCRGFTKMDDSADNLEHPPNCVKVKDLNRLHMLDSFIHCGVQIGDKKKYVIKATDVITEIHPKNNLLPDVLTKQFHSIVFKDGLNPDFTSVKQLEVESPKEIKCQVQELPVEKGESSETNQLNVGESGNQSDEYISFDEEEEEEGDYETDKKEVTISDEGKSENPIKDKDITKKSKQRKKGGKARLRPLTKFDDADIPCDPGTEKAVEVCYTFSTANIMWQNGVEEKAVPSTELYPIHHLDELEFFPGDFVVDAKEDGNPGIYGVVINCDHLARTCMVRWMKTVDISKGEKPDESAPPTEVSVYDIKDHADFKFRPGHTVIRVAEPLNVTDSTPAVGQIHRIDPEGVLHVQWPNGDITHCYPQELYIVGDEMSEFDSDSDWETTDDEDEDDDDTDASWETENEEEVDEDINKSKTSDVQDADKMWWFLMQEKKGELDCLLQTSQTELGKLEDIFRKAKSEIHNPEQCFQDILSIYRKCRELEKIVKSTYFEEPELLALIGEVKKKLRKEKCRKINRHLKQVFENRRGQNIKGSDGSSTKVSTSVQTDHLEEFAVYKTTVCVQTDCDMEVDVQSNNIDTSCVPSSCSENCLSQCSSGSTDKLGNNVGHSMNSAEEEKCDNLDTGMLKKSLSEGAVGYAMNSASGTDQEDRNIDLCSTICREFRLRMTKVQEEVNKKIAQSSTGVSPKSKEGNVSQKEVEGKVDFIGSDNCTSDDKHDSDMKQSVSFQGETKGSTEVSVKADLKVEDKDDAVTCKFSYGDLLSDIKESIDLDTFQGQEIEKDQVTSNSSEQGSFILESEVPLSHNYRLKDFVAPSKSFMTAVNKELKLLQSSLPKGITVKGFEDRLDLFSAMIIGPAKTPYEDAPFFFDIYLPPEYPKCPPLFYYIAFCSDRLNPNLYDDGNVCVSLLGTWEGKDKENWTSSSNLLQVLVSIQGLILVSEPYFNEAGYERQRGTQQGNENSKTYNEMALLKLVQSVTKMIQKPPHGYRMETLEHMKKYGTRFVCRIEHWLQLSELTEKLPTEELPLNGSRQENVDIDADNSNTPANLTGTNTSIPEGSLPTDRPDEDPPLGPPEFPFLPASKGFCITMKKNLAHLKEQLTTLKS